jgi:hypothetical protein
MRSIGFCAAGVTILLIGIAACSSLNAQTIYSNMVRAPAPPRGSVDGWTLTVKSTVDSGRSAKPRVSISRYRVTARTARTDTERLDAAPSLEAVGNPVMLVDDSAHTTTQISERQRSAAVIAGSFNTDVTLSVDPTSRFIVSPTMTIRDLGAGERILGHATHKYSVSTAAVSRTTFGGRPCRRTIDSVEQLWVAADLPREERLRNYVRDVHVNLNVQHGAVPDSMARLRAKRERLINGFVLRSITTSKAPDATGVVRTTTTTLEVTEQIPSVRARSSPKSSIRGHPAPIRQFPRFCSSL